MRKTYFSGNSYSIPINLTKPSARVARKPEFDLPDDLGAMRVQVIPNHVHLFAPVHTGYPCHYERSGLLAAGVGTMPCAAHP